MRADLRISIKDYHGNELDPSIFAAFFRFQCWFKVFVILANHPRSFANSNTSTEAKYLTLFG